MAFNGIAVSYFPLFPILKWEHLDHLSRDELIEGFTALIAICQHFCTPIIGERDAHRLILKALQELVLPLASLGVFRIDSQLLASGDQW